MDVPVQQDGVTSLAASDYNQTNTELEAMIEKSGQTKSAGDLVQVEKAVQQIAVSGQFYVDSGAANTITLANPNNPILEAYRDGARVIFSAANTNTGASTLTIDSLTAKNIKTINDTAITAGFIQAGWFYEAIYVASLDVFVLNYYNQTQNPALPKQYGTYKYAGGNVIAINPDSLSNSFNAPILTNVVSQDGGTGSFLWVVTYGITYVTAPLIVAQAIDLANISASVINVTTTFAEIVIKTLADAYALNGFNLLIFGQI